MQAAAAAAARGVPIEPCCTQPMRCRLHVQPHTAPPDVLPTAAHTPAPLPVCCCCAVAAAAAAAALVACSAPAERQPPGPMRLPCWHQLPAPGAANLGNMPYSPVAHRLPRLLTRSNDLRPHAPPHMRPCAHNHSRPSLLPRTFRRWFSTRRCRWMRTYLGHFTKRRMSRLPGRSPPMPAEQQRQGNQNTRRRGGGNGSASARGAMPLQARVARIAAAPAPGPSAAPGQHAAAAAHRTPWAASHRAG